MDSSKGSSVGTGTGTVDEGHSSVSHGSTPGVRDFFQSITRPFEKARLEARSALDDLGGTRSTGVVDSPAGGGHVQGSSAGTWSGTRREDEGHSPGSHASSAKVTVGDTLDAITSPIDKGRLEARAALDGLAGKGNTGV